MNLHRKRLSVFTTSMVFFAVIQIFVFEARARLPRWSDSTWDTARLLPPGEQNLSFSVQTSKSSKSFGGDGTVVDSGQPYGYSTSFGELIERSGDKGAAVRSYLKQQGVSEATPVFSTEFSLEASETRSALSWSRGVTEWWMIGMRVPYVQSRTRISTSQKLSPEYQKLKNQLNAQQVGDNPVGVLVEEQKQPVLDLDLQSNEYDQLDGTVEYKGVGDIELLSQLKVFETKRLYGAFRQRVVVPTGNNEGPYTYIKSNSADGQMDLGLDALVDFQASRRWALTGLLGYTVQFEDTQAARVPDDQGSQIQWKVDEDVKRDLGDIFFARVHSVYRLIERYWMTAGFEWAQKSEDKYSGSEFEDWQYNLMEAGTSENRQLARIGFRYISKPWRYDLLSTSSFSAGLEYFTVVAGKNTPKADATAFEFRVSY